VETVSSDAASGASSYWQHSAFVDYSPHAAGNNLVVAASVDSRGVDLVGVGASNGPFVPDFMPLAGGSGQQGAPGGPTVSLTTTQAAQQITRDGYHWGTTIGAPDTITFGFHTVAPSYTVFGENVAGTFSAFTAAEQAATRAVLALWASIANVTFTDLGNSDSATIEFANYSSSTDGSEAFTFLPSPPGDTSGAGTDGDVFVNTHYASTTTAGDAPLTYVFMTLLHETGHALGLEHPSNYNAGSGSITYANNASYIQDDRQYSVMSYFAETNTGANYGGKYNETPMLDDVAAIQRLYGANTNTQTGNTTYGFNSNAGSPYSVTLGSQAVIFNVWDGGGNDTFDFSGYSQAQTINLNAESFSNVGALIGNVSISLGVTIENAIGGSGSDTIIGNSADNRLTGGAGNDTLDGGAGTDTAVFSGQRTAYTLALLGNGSIQVAGLAGTDTLTNVERLAFNDQTVNASQVTNYLSVVTVTGSLLLTPGNWLDFNTANLPISVTDADGDPIVTYRFTDVGTRSTSAVLWFSGDTGGFVTQGGTVDVPANQLSNFWIQGGSAGGIDTLQVQVFDGNAWSTAKNISVVTDTPPAVSAATTSFGLSQTVAASSIFGVSDADGDSITQYKVTDATVGGAALLLNGVAQTENTPITVSAANLAQLQIATSSVAHDVNQFLVSAYDGFDWSAATSISVVSGNVPSAETVTAALQVTPSQWLEFNTANLPISVTDANNDSVVTYRFTDVGTDAASTHLWFSGLPGSGYVAQGGSVDVPASQLAGLWLQGGTTTGVDTLRVRVFDGFDWSAPQDVSVITSPPTTNMASNAVTGAVTGASNILTGTAGSDTFVFAPNFGNDTINNFTPGQDVIAIDHSIFATAAAVMLNTTDDGHGNSVIHADANDSITIQSVTPLTLALHLTDFHIV
jgi:hypothetical protein